MAAIGGKTAFIFTGGGSLGAIQVGMLRVLLSSGVKPDFCGWCVSWLDQRKLFRWRSERSRCGNVGADLVWTAARGHFSI